MTAHSAAQRIVAGTPVRLVSAGVMKDRMNEIHSLVASRAFELFEKRGRVNGGDINDWLHAEHELIHSCRHDMKESADAFVFDAKMPGSLTVDQLEVSVEPRRLIFYGETEVSVTYLDGKTVRKEIHPRRIFRIQDLSIGVEPSKATATLKGDILEVMMPKATQTDTPDGTSQEASAAK
jgi:HSP20 family molecular chaperone IbpA